MKMETDTLERARVLLAARRYQDAAALAYQCAASRLGDPNPLIIASWAEIGLRNRDAAAQAARQAVALAPGLPEAHRVLVAALTQLAYARARSITRRRTTRPALAAARRLVELAPEEVTSHWAMTDAAVASQKVRLAVSSSSTALEMAPQSAMTWLLRARAARRAGDLQVAESAVREALRLDPENYNANTELGIIMRGRGRTADGLRQLKSTASLDPAAPYAPANLRRYGMIFLQVPVVVLMLPIFLITHETSYWIVGSFLTNFALWRFRPSRQRLERLALSIALWRSRRSGRRSRRRASLVSPRTPIQLYRSQRTILALFLLLLVVMSVLVTGVVVRLPLPYLPLWLLPDVWTIMFAWLVLKRFLPRPVMEK